MHSVEHVASLISGRRRQRNINAPLEKLLLTEYFAESLDDNVLQQNIPHNAREIVAMDYAGLNHFGAGFLRDCCSNTRRQQSFSSERRMPESIDRIAAAAYIHELKTSAKSLAGTAGSVQELKELMLVDLLVEKKRYSFNSLQGIHNILIDLSSRYLSSSARAGNFWARAKYPLLAAIAAGALATGIFSGINACNTSRTNENAGYHEKLVQFGKCESYLLSDNYRQAFNCGNSLLEATKTESHYYNSQIEGLCNSLDERMQQDMYKDYSLKLQTAEAGLLSRDFNAAESLCNKVKEDMAQADFFGKRSEILKAAETLESRIALEKEKQNTTGQEKGIIAALGDYLSSGYDRLHSFFLMLGFGQTGSDIAASLLLFLPIYGIARKIKKRKS